MGFILKFIRWVFVVAPFIAHGRPVRLKGSATVLPEVSESRVSAEISLRGGERLWVKVFGV